MPTPVEYEQQLQQREAQLQQQEQQIASQRKSLQMLEKPGSEAGVLERQKAFQQLGEVSGQIIREREQIGIAKQELQTYKEQVRKQQAYEEGYRLAIEDLQANRTTYLAGHDPDMIAGYTAARKYWYEEQARYGTPATTLQFGTEAEKARIIPKEATNVVVSPDFKTYSYDIDGSKFTFTGTGTLTGIESEGKSFNTFKEYQQAQQQSYVSSLAPGELPIYNEKGILTGVQSGIFQKSYSLEGYQKQLIEKPQYQPQFTPTPQFSDLEAVDIGAKIGKEYRAEKGFTEVLAKQRQIGETWTKGNVQYTLNPDGSISRNIIGTIKPVTAEDITLLVGGTGIAYKLGSKFATYGVFNYGKLLGSQLASTIGVGTITNIGYQTATYLKPKETAFVTSLFPGGVLPASLIYGTTGATQNIAELQAQKAEGTLKDIEKIDYTKAIVTGALTGIAFGAAYKGAQILGPIFGGATQYKLASSILGKTTIGQIGIKSTSLLVEQGFKAGSRALEAKFLGDVIGTTGTIAYEYSEGLNKRATEELIGVGSSLIGAKLGEKLAARTIAFGVNLVAPTRVAITESPSGEGGEFKTEVGSRQKEVSFGRKMVEYYRLGYPDKTISKDLYNPPTDVKTEQKFVRYSPKVKEGKVPLSVPEFALRSRGQEFLFRFKEAEGNILLKTYTALKKMPLKPQQFEIGEALPEAIPKNLRKRILFEEKTLGYVKKATAKEYYDYTQIKLTKRILSRMKEDITPRLQSSDKALTEAVYKFQKYAKEEQELVFRENFPKPPSQKGFVYEPFSGRLFRAEIFETLKPKIKPKPTSTYDFGFFRLSSGKSPMLERITTSWVESKPIGLLKLHKLFHSSCFC